MLDTSCRRLATNAIVIVVAAAALAVPLTRLQAQQPATPVDGPAGYNIACSIQASSGLRDCVEPPQGNSCDMDANFASQPSNESTGITFVNRSDKPVKVYWLNFQGKRILYNSLRAGGRLVQQTFVGHNWLVTTSTEQCVGIFETVPQSVVDNGSVAIAPPEIPVYEQPSPPDEDLVWTPGYWDWSEDGSDYYWVPGTWAAAPIVGYLWTPGYWVARSGVFAWHAGYWGPHVGFYGGINYGHGYFGHGYVGGSWRDGHMMYNSAVINLANFRANHTYSQPVPNYASRPQPSYSSGGVQPSAAELAAAAEYHIPPTSAQLQQLHTARDNPALRARANNGHPSFGAISRSGEFSNPATPQVRHAGTLSITHVTPPLSPAPAATTGIAKKAAPATPATARAQNQPRTPQPQAQSQPQEHAAQSPAEPQPAPQETQQPRPKSSPAPARAAPHPEGHPL
jgi:VHL beta domain/WXXGXW repeat (2 copies)